MAKASGGVGYAQGQWTAADGAWCDFMDQAQETCFDHERKDVAKRVMRVLRRCHVAMWPASRWTKESKSWSQPYASHPMPAFRISEAELASQCKLSRQSVHNALKCAEEHGLIVRLASAGPRGEGRGATATTYAFACYLPALKAQNKTKAAKVKKPASGGVAMAQKFGAGKAKQKYVVPSKDGLQPISIKDS